MKVLLVNGSSRPNGCTAQALTAVADALEKEGVETETVFIGNNALHQSTILKCVTMFNTMPTKEMPNHES